MTHADLEVDIKSDPGKAVIEGKTSVPFRTLVTLIVQRKVGTLFEAWGKDPVIVSSELLTNLASAPQDSQENRAQLVMVTLGVGILAGVFGFSIIQILLLVLGVELGTKELFMIAGSLVGLAGITVMLMKTKKKNRAEKVMETMEKVTAMLPKK